jgi:hypothetical protein
MKGEGVGMDIYFIYHTHTPSCVEILLSNHKSIQYEMQPNVKDGSLYLSDLMIFVG